MTERMVPIETARRRAYVDGTVGSWHDFEGHLDALEHGVHVDCFCVRTPYVRWVPATDDTVTELSIS